MSVHSVLIVSPIPSHPADQGNAARIQAEATELRRRNIAADFLYYGMEGMSDEQFAAMTQFWRRFFFLKSVPLAPASLARTWGLDDWCSDVLCDHVAMICRKHHYDAVIVNYVWMSRIFERIDGPLRILDTHDLFGDRHLVSEASALEPRWYFTTKAEEDRGFARADVVIGIQKNESRTLAARHSGRTITVGHPIAPHFLLRSRPAASSAFTFGYLGSGNPFNLASVAALDRAIAATGLDWALAGTISKRQLDLASHPYRMGMVEKLADFYDAVECVLNPMMGGTGLKIKTIEALAFGRPIIGTVDAFEGIDTRHPFHRLDDIGSFAEAMRSYQASEPVRQELRAETYRVFAGYMAEVTTQYDHLAAIVRNGREPARLAGAA